MSAPLPPPPPGGVNMPKKRDPRLRGILTPSSKQFFDSADYEVRKQQQQGHGVQPLPQQQNGGVYPQSRPPVPSGRQGVSRPPAASGQLQHLCNGPSIHEAHPMGGTANGTGQQQRRPPLAPPPPPTLN